MKLEIAVLAGADSKAFLVNLTKVVERMEKAAGIKPAKASAAIDDDDDIETDDVEEDDEDLAPKKTVKGKKAKPVDDSEDEDDEVVDDSEDEDEDDEDLKPKSAKGKAKKLTVDHVIDACKAYAKNYAKENECSAKEGIDYVKKLLKKNFKTVSTSEIDEADYAKAIKLLAV